MVHLGSHDLAPTITLVPTVGGMLLFRRNHRWCASTTSWSGACSAAMKPPGNTASTSGGASRSFAERAYDRLGVAVDDCQQDAGCPVRDPPPLFRRCCRASSTSTWRDGW